MNSRKEIFVGFFVALYQLEVVGLMTRAKWAHLLIKFFLHHTCICKHIMSIHLNLEHNADEVGVPNPYEAPAAFSKLHGRDTTNGIEKNFNNPLYQEGSISPTSPPLPPRPEHPYAMLEEVNGPYDQISNPPLPTEGSPNLKCEELSETPYLDPKGASTYAHIPGDFVPPENSLPTLDLPASEEALGPEMANPYDHIASNSANGVLPELSPAQDLSASAPKQDTETPYLDPVNAMNSSTSIYAHIS